MDRKECYRLTHPLSKISGYATVSTDNKLKDKLTTSDTEQATVGTKKYVLVSLLKR